MKPLILQGHTRPLTQVKYNRDGDLLFTTAKDSWACVWYSNNGERLGTFGKNGDRGERKDPEQHRSVIWTIDVARDSMHALTGSGDTTAKIWDVSTGQCTQTFNFESSVRSINYSLDSNLFCCTQDRQMTYFAKLFVVDKRESDKKVMEMQLSTESLMATRCAFGAMDEFIITGDEKGCVKKYDWRNWQDWMDESNIGIAMCELKEHTSAIKDMQLSDDGTMLLTASKDKTAKLFDAVHEDNFQLIKTFKHPANVNSAAFNPVKNHVALGGGQEAMDVTTTGAGQGYFETYMYNMISQDSFCNFRGHFGPINSLAYHPNGSQLCTGGEEGLVRINPFDSSYLNYRDLDFEVSAKTQTHEIVAAM